MNRFGTGVVLAGLLVLVGCKSPAYQNAVYARAKALQVSPEYRMGEGDFITIKVLDQDPGARDILVNERIRPDGKIGFPRHGDIVATGKTPEELRAELEQSFQQTLQLKDPKVYVAVNRFFSKNVTVLGEVLRPGQYPYTGQTRVADLLGLAIGTQPLSAAPNRTLLFREVDGQMKVYHVNLKDFFDKADFKTNFYLRPGDVVYVPRNGFAIVANGVAKVMQPIAALLGAVGLGQRTVNFWIPSPARGAG
jgi:polysaccharide export outer membrane protein